MSVTLEQARVLARECDIDSDNVLATANFLREHGEHAYKHRALHDSQA